MKKFWPHRSNAKGFSIKYFSSKYRDKISKLSSNEILNHFSNDVNLKSMGKDDNHKDIANIFINRSHWANRDFSEYRDAA